MSLRRREARRHRRARRARPVHEWVGGVLWPPIVIETPEPTHAGWVVWLELPDNLIVGQDVVEPGKVAGALTSTLREALAKPLIGAPRMPGMIRVADNDDAAEVRAEFGETIPVRIAPTPELEDVLKDLIESLPDSIDDEASYFANGKISADAVADLFSASSSLLEIAPWKSAADTQFLRMNIPDLGVDGACISIIGKLGAIRGVMVFPSRESVDAFVAACAPGASPREPFSLGTGYLSLTFVPVAELSRLMQTEAAHCGWPVEDGVLCPVVDRFGGDGLPIPLEERDVAIAVSCARALTAFFVKHADRFDSNTITPVFESFHDGHDREVQLKVPYEAFEGFELTEPTRSARPSSPLGTASRSPSKGRVGRNDPCPCGSGRKYKRCHLAADEGRSAGVHTTARLHTMDYGLMRRLIRFAKQEFGPAWEGFKNDFADTELNIQLSLPWSVYCFEVNGRTVAGAYLDHHEHRCTVEERRWLNAQRTAWLSVWEVEAVDYGKSLTLHDLLSHERRTVQEKSGSETLVWRDCLLCRVVDYGDISLVSGIHVHPLPPREAAGVVRRARSRRPAKRPVPIERLRKAAFGRRLIRNWERAIESQEDRRIELRNSDHHRFVHTVDHFDIQPGAGRELDARIADLEGAEWDDSDPDSPRFAISRPSDPAEPEGRRILLGRVYLEAAELRIETDSTERADALRQRVEAACGSRIRHRQREKRDQMTFAMKRPDGPLKPAKPPTPIDAQALAEFKVRHYADWPDRPVPLLDQMTPRECARTAAGREKVDLLVKDMENFESRFQGPRFDFSGIRRELGLAPK
ncbi:MAG: SEC-C domain-containing protein [Bryobacterales bacterium]|nr:SEC-C domain-containing protein [Bryobacterales bacterium]